MTEDFTKTTSCWVHTLPLNNDFDLKTFIPIYCDYIKKEKEV